MAKFWFISAPLAGHLDWGGFLKTALCLQKQGHDVLWISGSAISNTVTQTGLKFQPIKQTGWLWPPPPAPDVSQIPPQQAVMLRYQRALDTWLSEELVGDAAAEIIQLASEIGTPDLIVTDPFLSAAALAAEALACPLAVCGWVAQQDLDESKFFPVQKTLAEESQQRIHRLLDRFGLQGVNFAQGPTPSVTSPHLHISYFNEQWYQTENAILLPQNRFVGGRPHPTATPTPQWLQDIPDSIPLILITLGSVFTGDLGFFSWAAQAAAHLRHVPVVVIGNNPFTPEEKATLKQSLPPVTRLLNWVDYEQVLPRAKLIIHHGGMGTTHAAAIHGIPQLVVPHAADQRGQARRVAMVKVGLNLTAHDVRNGALLEGSKALLTDQRVQATARQFAADLAELGGPEKAAEHLLALL